MARVGLKTATVCGIPCSLRTASSRRVVSRVLRQIERRFPKDFARLLARVLMIRPVPKSKMLGGTGGEWIARTFEQAYCTADPFTLPVAIRLQWDEWESGIVELAESEKSGDELAANAAHEFGHACTLTADIDRRCAPSDEWGSEAAADWYAYKWGFGKLLAAGMKTRCLGHHGPGPGQIVEIENCRFKLSRNFVFLKT